MKDSKSLECFRASFQKWFNKSGLKQYQAGMVIELSQSFVTKFLRGDIGVSFGQADDIAEKLNTTLIDMILEGQKLLGNQNDVPNSKFTPEQEQAKEAFEFLLLHGGEGAEIIADQAIRLANKKQAEVDYQNPTPAKLSKSA